MIHPRPTFLFFLFDTNCIELEEFEGALLPNLISNNNNTGEAILITFNRGSHTFHTLSASRDCRFCHPFIRHFQLTVESKKFVMRQHRFSPYLLNYVPCVKKKKKGERKKEEMRENTPPANYTALLLPVVIIISGGR